MTRRYSAPALLVLVVVGLLALATAVGLFWLVVNP